MQRQHDRSGVLAEARRKTVAALLKAGSKITAVDNQVQFSPDHDACLLVWCNAHVLMLYIIISACVQAPNWARLLASCMPIKLDAVQTAEQEAKA